MKKVVGLFVFSLMLISLVSAGCPETDDGHNIFEKGSEDEYCVDENTVYEEICIAWVVPFGSEEPCPSNHVCSDGACVLDKDVILNIYSDSNSHGEVHDGVNYDLKIKHSDIFGSNIASDTVHDCTGSNYVLSLSSVTNAHAEFAKTGGNYATDICYGSLVCDLKDECETGEECVVALSDTTNAHLALCDSPAAYENKVCCKSAPCEDFTTKQTCWNAGCFWTPPGSDDDDDEDDDDDDKKYGCCPFNQEWNGITCIDTSANICNNAWTGVATGELFSPQGPFSEDGTKYCAQVTSGITTGLWYDVETY